MSQYSQTSLTSATTQLAIALRDPSSSYWSLSEKYSAIIEALRIFQSLTGYYRERAIITTAASTAFYDLRTELPNVYQFTITDDDLLAEIQAALLEPIANPWTGTDQFSIASITSAMSNVRDAYMLDTGLYITRSTPGGPSPLAGRFQLDQSIIDIRRAAWMDSATTDTFSLYRSDEYAANSYLSGWQQEPGLPYQYSVALTPPVSLQLIPSPINSGTLDLCTVNSGPTISLNPASPVVLGIPNDFCWGTKWGTLAQLLTSDGDVRFPTQAAYCQQMYNLAVSAGKYPIVALTAAVNDVNIPIGSIDDFDKYNPGWQSDTGIPSQCAFVGANLLALSGDSNSGTGIPDGIYSVSLDFVRSFPIPDITAPSTSYLQVGVELLNAILDMAQHICSFKMSGTEFADTIPLRVNFLNTCAQINGRLRANVFFNQLLNQPATRQSNQVPRLMEVHQ